MQLNSKGIKKKIGSVKNTKKITKSMQMISSIKMQKAVNRHQQFKEYALRLEDLTRQLSRLEEVDNPFLEKRQIKNELIVLIGSNRGLCGVYNSNLIRYAHRLYLKMNQETPTFEDGDTPLAVRRHYSVLSIGKKPALFAKKEKLELVGLYEQAIENGRIESIWEITRFILNGYLNEQFDRVQVVYTKYNSALSQNVTSFTLLPLTINQQNQSVESENSDEQSDPLERPMWESSAQFSTEYLVPMIVENMLYDAVLNGIASEHSSRMIAMKNATDNASWLSQELTLAYNKSRQSSVTQEIIEIITGMESLAAL